MIIVVGIAVLCVFFYFGVPFLYGRYNKFQLKKQCVKSRSVVLTFDDGPGHRLTGEILKILETHKVKATFFLLGRNIEGKSDIVRKIAQADHEIGSHGYDHLNYWRVSPLRAIADIKKGWLALDKAIGGTGSVYPFRPPYGKLNLATLIFLWTKNVPICFWTTVSGDTWPENKRSSERASRLVKKAGGGVVLMHDMDRKDESVENMVLDTLRRILAAADERQIRVKTFSQIAASN